jgi:hypothetical protein
MPDPFASPKRRITRAGEHIQNLKSEVAAFFEAQPYARIVERNASGFDEHKVKLTRELPDRITDFAYETIEALRSSLDQATYAVAIACGSKRPDLIHFPIADTPADFENVLNGRLKDFPPDILALFHSFEPYQTGNANLIWALNRVRRQGTHRLIVPVATVAGGMEIHDMSISRPLPLTVPPPRWDSEKKEIVFAIVAPGSDLSYKLDLSFYITFGQVEGVAAAPVVETLEDMAAEVERVVLAIEAESHRIGLIT